MNTIERLEAQQACADVIVRYALAVNQWDLDAFVALFAEDGSWKRPGTPEMRGRKAIRNFMDSLPTDRVLRHVNGGVLIEVIDDHTASAWSQTTVYEFPRPSALPAPLSRPDMVVEYRDRLVNVGGRWLIAHRNTVVVFRAEA